MSTSKLQRQVSEMLSVHLGQYTIRENYCPKWLDGLQIDLYVEELRAGVEVQGQQHYEYIPHFHKSYAGLLEQQKRDNRKIKLCADMGVWLYHIRYPSRLLILRDCLLSLSASYIESNHIEQPVDTRLRPANRDKRHLILLSRAGHAAEAQDASRLKYILEQIESHIEERQLYVSDRHIRKLFALRLALLEMASNEID